MDPHPTRQWCASGCLCECRTRRYLHSPVLAVCWRSLLPILGVPLCEPAVGRRVSRFRGRVCWPVSDGRQWVHRVLHRRTACTASHRASRAWRSGCTSVAETMGLAAQARAPRTIGRGRCDPPACGLRRIGARIRSAHRGPAMGVPSALDRRVGRVRSCIEMTSQPVIARATFEAGIGWAYLTQNGEIWVWAHSPSVPWPWHVRPLAWHAASILQVVPSAADAASRLHRRFGSAVLSIGSVHSTMAPSSSRAATEARS